LSSSTYTSDFVKELRKRDSAMKGKTNDMESEVDEAKKRFMHLKQTMKDKDILAEELIDK
jgi:hypothetical protein